jgi:hypothetical protein
VATGCVRGEKAPASGPPVTGAPQSEVVAVEPPLQPVTPPATSPTEDQSVAKADPAGAKPPEPVMPPEKPSEKAPEKVLASPGTTDQSPKKESTAPAPVKPPAPPAPPAPPTLDLASLEQRLRDTKAIGLFTKISLKNQVDDLLTQFRAFHGGRGGAPLTELRERYNLLLLKVLSLLQGGEPTLAQAIAGSREAIWGVLVDPVKFAKL